MRDFFRSIYARNPREFVGLIALSTLSALTGGVGIVMIIPMLAVLDISSDSSGALAAFLGAFDFLSKPQLLGVILGIYLVLMILKAVLTGVLSVLNERMVGKYTLYLRTTFYESIALSDWQRFKQLKRSDLSNYFAVETNRISQGATYAVKLVVLAITSVVNVAIALVMSVPVTLATVAVGAGAYFLLKRIRRETRRNGRAVHAANESLMAEVAAQLDGIREIRSYGVERDQAGLFAKAAEDYRVARLRYAKLAALPQALISIGAAAIVVAGFLVCYLALGMSIARIAVLVYALTRLWPSLSTLQSYTQALQNLMPTWEDYRDTVERLRESEGAEGGADVDASGDEPLPIEGDIELRGVCFGYEDGDGDAQGADAGLIENVSMTLRKGEITALVGPNGAGKSTLVDILLGFLEPTSGEVLFDGQAAHGGENAMHRRAVSYIPQEPLLLHASVRENLRRFHPRATEEEIVAALGRAQVLDVVESLPEGLDTVLGDKGIRLSGGERQRIVLARALVGSPSLVVLDEATSALDYESEHKIRDVLVGLRGETTVLMIAHRLSTIRSADHVVVLRSGRVVEDGTFEDLVQSPGGYLSRMRD